MNIPSSIELAAYEYVVNSDAAETERVRTQEAYARGESIQATEAAELNYHYQGQAEMYRTLLFQLVRQAHQDKLNGKR